MQGSKIGIIGFGFMGKIHHKELITGFNPQIKRVYVYDVKKEALEKARKFGAIPTSLEKLIEKSDIIVVCVPTKYHYNVLMKIAEINSKAIVVCEKPCTESLKQFQEVYKSLEKLFVNCEILNGAVYYFPRIFKGNIKNIEIKWTALPKHDYNIVRDIGFHAISVALYFLNNIRIDKMKIVEDGVILYGNNIRIKLIWAEKKERWVSINNGEAFIDIVNRTIIYEGSKIKFNVFSIEMLYFNLLNGFWLPDKEFCLKVWKVMNRFVEEYDSCCKR